MGRKYAMSIKIEPVQKSTLEQFCHATRRSMPDVVRAAIDLLLADGLEEAERRLTTGLWSKAQPKSDGRKRSAS